MHIAKRQNYGRGDWVIYRKTKHSDHPGPRAQRISPSPNGDEYTYLVDKFWVVDEVLPNGDLRIRTRRGKHHTVSANDPNLRRANWWERLWYRGRFESVAEDTPSEIGRLQQTT